MTDNSQFDLLAYAYQYVRANDLINELSADLKSPFPDEIHMNKHIKFLINHPEIIDQKERICTLLLNANKKNLLEKDTKVEIAHKFPRIADEMIPVVSVQA
jgi:hypothetical protein